jgi:glutathione synthase/RimK-type ligase-like ATP-grasp enzyme
MFVVVGNPGCPRVAGFQAALARCGLPPAVLVAYIDLITGRDALEQYVVPGSFVRLESPGRDFDVEKALIAEGADEPDVDGPARIGRDEALRLEFDKGRIWYPRQWFRGFRAVLRKIARQLTGCPGHVVLSPPADVEMLFDKPRCQELFARSGIPVPAVLGPVRSFDELRLRMREADCREAFVKLAHGSSASGVVAYRTDGVRQEAVTTVEMARTGGELRMYNSRLIRRYTRHADVALLIDTLAREGVQAEEWLPKAKLDEHEFDLRVLVIGGKARHVVVRMSKSPMTNLHLGGHRGEVAAVTERMGADAWQEALWTCEGAAALLPGSLHVGVDLLVGPDYRRHAVLEGNAFGDLLPGVACEGVDTYEAEVRAATASDF